VGVASVTDAPILIGKYRIERELGRGAMGVVYQAFDPVVERHVAIKTMRFDHSGSTELLELLKREAKSVGRFEHPNIITLYDAGEVEGLFYMVMQLVQGETLRDRMARQRWYKLPQIVDIFRQVLAGLNYAHERGVVHRDIKPANIMINSEGFIKVADFGIAKVIGPGTSSSGLVIGTPSYMSPEQILSRSVDARSDIFSVGCTLYEVLTGEKAYPGDTATAVMYKIVHQAPVRPATLRPGLDARLEEVVLKALANDPDDRFQTCSEMAQALEKCLVTPAASFQTIASHATAAPPFQPAKPSVISRLTRHPKFLPIGFMGGFMICVLIVIAIMSLTRRPVYLRLDELPPSQLLKSNSTLPMPALSATPPEPASELAAQKPVDANPTPSTSSTSATPTSTRQQAETKVYPPGRATTLRGPQSPVSELRVDVSVKPPNSSPRVMIEPVPETELEDFNSLIMRGDMAFQENAYNRALAEYTKASQLKPGNSSVRRKIKVVLTLLGRDQEAQKYR
jgi:serine/threonine protein kinase